MISTNPPRQIFVAGTWSATKAAPYASSAFEVGCELARAGFDLTTGPGTGISGHVINGYKSRDARGTVRIYLPRKEEMEKVGETVGADVDQIIQTDYDYPMRNVYHISKSNGLIILTGGDGTLEECLPALIDYNVPVIVLRESGSAAIALEYLSQNLYRDWLKLLRFVDEPHRLVPELLALMSECSAV